MISIVALSIDGMLPALPAIGKDLNVSGENAPQLIISTVFLGLALGQLVFGPWSDSIGRKRPIYVGFGLFILGCLVSQFSTNFSTMLLGRFLQGLGVAAPRSVSLALVRDLFEGNKMAEVMSYVMSVFILIPMIAPAYGQAVLAFLSWRAIFASFIILALVSLVWFMVRQPETLSPKERKPFSLAHIKGAVKEIVSNRQAFGYTIIAGLIGGAFVGYLNSAQQIFQEQYALGSRFPLIFAIISLGLGIASLANARLVFRFGMEHLARLGLRGVTLLSFVALLFAFLSGGHPPLSLFMAYLMLTFFCVGILFGNLNALAMQPLGHIAGIGAAVVGAFSTFLSVPLGTAVGLAYNETVIPLIIGLAVLGLLSLGVMGWIRREAV